MSLEHAPERGELTLADDLLIGAEAIAAELGVTEAAVYAPPHRDITPKTKRFHCFTYDAVRQWKS